MGQLQRDLDRAYAREARLGEKLANASAQLAAARRHGAAGAVKRFEKDIEYLQVKYEDAGEDAQQIREAL